MRLPRLLVMACGGVVVLSAGCGGGGSGGGAAQDPLAQGRASLSQLVSGQTATNAQTLQSALDLYNQALQQSPNSPEANFGAAILLEVRPEYGV
jgi:hypothetical protein